MQHQAFLNELCQHNENHTLICYGRLAFYRTSLELMVKAMLMLRQPASSPGVQQVCVAYKWWEGGDVPSAGLV